MSYVRVESSVPRNLKFLKAGPAAAWLWLCGLAYCQEGLTDGFIPREALPTLGVLKGAEKLATLLVLAGLWDALDEGGWRVHDYLDHNRSATDVETIKAIKRTAGKKGGEASGVSRIKQSAEAESSNVLKQPVNPTVAVVVVDAEPPVNDLKKTPASAAPLDEWFRELLKFYPKERVTSGHLTESYFVQQFIEDGRPYSQVWADMLGGLRNQIAGHEWRVKGMVPKLEKWLREGLWKQRHEVNPPSAVVSEKTARTLSSAAEFVKGGSRGAS